MSTPKHLWIGIALVLGLSAPAGAGEPGPWEKLAEFAWGEGPGELGRAPAREEELAWGPHGIALAPGGELAIVDRVNGRALLLDREGRLENELATSVRSGPALLLDGGTLAVLDQGTGRLVHFLGSGSPSLRSPSWAMPPRRLVSWTGGDDRPVIEGLDAFQLRQPLAAAGFSFEPHELPRGVPSGNGRTSVWAALRDAEVVVGFGAHPVSLDPWEHWGSSPHPLASVDVLAAEDDRAVLVFEAVSTAAGPLVVDRAVGIVDRLGRVGPLLTIPERGTIRVPSDLAALADGTVLLLVADEGGCRLWRGRAGQPGEGGER